MKNLCCFTIMYPSIYACIYMYIQIYNILCYKVFQTELNLSYQWHSSHKSLHPLCSPKLSTQEQPALHHPMQTTITRETLKKGNFQVDGNCCVSYLINSHHTLLWTNSKNCVFAKAPLQAWVVSNAFIIPSAFVYHFQNTNKKQVKSDLPDSLRIGSSKSIVNSFTSSGQICRISKKKHRTHKSN